VSIVLSKKPVITGTYPADIFWAGERARRV
jgi:hypothetical protein